jgi:hypothetical protein
MRALRWLGITLVGLAVTAGTIWAIGSRLPVAHRATVTDTIAGDVDAVWRRIEHVEAWPTWQDAAVEVLAEDSVRVRQAGQVLEYRIRRPRPRTMVTEIVTPGLPFGGRWTWSVDPGPSGSAIVTIVEDGEVYDPFFRFFGRFVFGYDGTIRATMDALRSSFDGSGKAS